MSSSSTSSIIQKPKLFKVDLDGNVYCHHDIVAVLRVAGLKSKRYGEEFYGCSHCPRGDCKFFLWKEDVDNMLIERSNGTSTPVTFKDLKIKNLELHKMLLI
ncbi:putative transcription factor GRF family [Helianthus annuus]|nr:putative transcription factor GRF family [Helianthus annuus]